MPAWLLRAQGKLGTITGTISLGIGLLAWLEMDVTVPPKSQNP